MSFDSYFQSNAKEIVKDKLYWISADRTPKNLPKSFFFNIDNDLVYEPLSNDFGPLDIGKTVRFVLELKKLLECPQFADSKIYHHTSTDFAKRANAAFLMGAFQVIILGKTAQEAWQPLSTVQPAFVPFRDALDGTCSYKCTILDCLQGLEYAMQLKWFDINKFDLKCYEGLSKLDVNWIIPGKILAFSAPFSQPKDSEGYKRFVPEDYTTSFKKLGVKAIIQLNSKDYDEKRFTQMGFKHHNIEMSGTQCPGNKLVEKFMSLCEEEKGVIAVHCKTGLGCSGTMVACYAMKNYHFPAASLIGWMRLCRPGSILGPQQQFLVKNEDSLCEKWVSACEVSSVDLDSHQEVYCQQQPYVFKAPKLTPLKELKMEDLKRMS